MPNGDILRQVKGIPMGDRLSPGMTIGTCAWMEREWMNTLTEADKKQFKAKRFMDDIIMICDTENDWEYGKFLKNFETECYQKPLKLEPGNEGTFLETQLWQEGGKIKHRIKNENRVGRMKVKNEIYSRSEITPCL